VKKKSLFAAMLLLVGAALVSSARPAQAATCAQNYQFCLSTCASGDTACRVNCLDLYNACRHF
jgi:uncharacterized protein YfaQ (DUF2300 family)